MQDGDGVHEVGQGAQEPPNPVKGGTLTKQLLQRGQMVRKQMQEEEGRRKEDKDEKLMEGWSCDKFSRKRGRSTCPWPSRTTFSRCSRSALWMRVRR